jgi:hypothetical protein
MASFFVRSSHWSAHGTKLCLPEGTQFSLTAHCIGISHKCLVQSDALKGRFIFYLLHTQRCRPSSILATLLVLHVIFLWMLTADVESAFATYILFVALSPMKVTVQFICVRNVLQELLRRDPVLWVFLLLLHLNWPLLWQEGKLRH